MANVVHHNYTQTQLDSFLMDGIECNKDIFFPTQISWVYNEVRLVEQSLSSQGHP